MLNSNCYQIVIAPVACVSSYDLSLDTQVQHTHTHKHTLMVKDVFDFNPHAWAKVGFPKSSKIIKIPGF